MGIVLCEVLKDKDDTLDYTLDYGGDAANPPWLPGTDVIIASSWFFDPTTDGTPPTVQSAEFTNKTTTIWLEGGTRGRYRLTNRIRTQGGRIADNSILIKVEGN